MYKRQAVIFVSHSQEQVQRICTQGILLKKGVSIFSGPVKDCFKAYHETLPPSEIFKISHHDDTILSAELTCSKERHRSGEDLSMRLSYKMDASFRLRIHVMMVRDESGTTVATVDLMPCLHLLNQGDTSLEFSIRALSLKPGTYTFLIETIAEEHARTLLRKEFALSLKVFGSLTYWSSYTPKAEIKELSTKEQLNKFLYAI